MACVKHNKNEAPKTLTTSERIKTLNPVSNIKDNMRLLYPARVVALGLGAAQVVATVLVYMSNRALAAKIAAIRAAGFGPLPGVDIAPPLKSVQAAFAGGAFFTLSTGAGIVVLTFVAVVLVLPLPGLYRVVRSRMLKPGFRFLGLAVLLTAGAAAVSPVAGWLVLLILANMHGFCPGLTAFLLLVPPVVILAAVKWSPQRAGYKRLPWRNPFHFVLIALLLAFWTSYVNRDVFVNFKDNLLLTSRPGTAIVRFYYRYTLYPAEVFKTLSDKQLKTCVLAGNPDPDTAGRLERALQKHDYFVIPAAGPPADLRLVYQGDRLILGQEHKPVLIVGRDRFLDETGEILEQFSGETDHNAVFRRFTIVSLLGMSPLVLYLASYAFFCLLPGALINIRTASFLAPVLCFIFWTGTITAMDIPNPAEMNRDRAAAAIRAGTRKERIAALRYIHDKRLDISGFKGYRKLASDTDFAQRYWLINSLGNSRDPAVTGMLYPFLESTSAYIVCKTLAAVADRGRAGDAGSRQRNLNLILEKMRATDNWYVQFYAYKAARSMGWMPKRSG